LARGITTGRYSQAGTVITVTNESYGSGAVGVQVYLTFLTGGAVSGIYTVDASPDTGVFTLTAGDSATRNGSVVFASHDGGYTLLDEGVNNRIMVRTETLHALNVNDPVWLSFDGNSTDGVYAVSEVADDRTFYVLTTNQPWDGMFASVFPLTPAPLTRSGTVTLDYSTWDMNWTDEELNQTPLNSPSVFNFYLPDYKFAGILASAGLTTPEFQLCSDTTVANQDNFIANALLFNQGTNTSGLCSFKDGDEDLTYDLGPWTSTNYASTNGIPVLIDSLSTLLMGSPLSTTGRLIIINYMTNISYTATNPRPSQVRDRVRGVVHQMLMSPDFNIQR
jgi:hypothetical protein